MRFLLFILLCTIVHTTTIAQEKDSTKTMSHYFGLQTNELFREILNFGDDKEPITNPYLFTYAMNNKGTGWGINFGFGYRSTSSEDGDDTFDRETKSSNLNLRIGLEKKSLIGKRFVSSLGMDFLYGKNKNNTFTKSIIDFGNDDEGSFTVDTDRTIKTFGIGPRVSFNFVISEKILIGTEATYYLQKSNIDDKVITETNSFIFDNNTGQQIPDFSQEETETSGATKNFHLELPLVLYLIIKL